MIERKSLAAFIFARGGSKGVKDKNIRNVAGKPLIAHTIQTALESQLIGRVIVSTDSQRIADVSKSYGAEILERPNSLAQDNTPEIEAWHHAISSRPDIFSTQNIFISLPATSPLRSIEDINNGIQAFFKRNMDILFAITPSRASPYLSMVRINECDELEQFIASGDAFRRQDVPKSYDITGCIYVANTNYVLACKRLTEGRCGYIVVPNSRALDIDEEYDLYLADLLLSNPFKPSEADS